MNNLPIPTSLLDKSSHFKKNIEKIDYKNIGRVLVGENGNPVTIDFNIVGNLLCIGSAISDRETIFDSLLQSIFWKYSPEDIRLIIADYQSDLCEYGEPNPYLLTEMISDTEKTISALRWTVKEMDNRYKDFTKAKSRSLYFFNQKIKVKKPLIIFIIKNIDYLMAAAPKDSEQLIGNIVSRGAKAGIHLILVTDKLSRTNVPASIASNIPNRIIFRMTNEEDSLSAGVDGADKLARNEFLLKLAYEKVIKSRTLLLESTNIKIIQDYFKKFVNEISYETNIRSNYFTQTDDASSDPLLDKAIEIIQQHDHASASLLQRRLAIGYARAARLLDQLEANGYVEPADGSKPRKVIKKKI